MDWFYCSNHECPACRAQCSSRRSQKKDTKNDGMILYIEKDDEEVICIYTASWIKNVLIYLNEK